MGKEKNISINPRDLPTSQVVGKKSLIHRCCGDGMITIKNIDPLNNSKFYVCNTGCGSTELPYLAQLLGLEGKFFYDSGNLNPVKS